MASSASFRPSLPSIRRYAVAAITLLAGFYGLHWTSNLLPQERSFTFVQQAFEAEVLRTTNKNVHTVWTVTGAHRFSDCRTLLSVVAPPSAKLTEALAPSVVKVTGTTDKCGRLYRIAVEGEKGHLSRLKVRYWHGSVALLATLLHIPSVTLLQVTETIKAANYFAWTLLALAAFAHSRRLFAVLGPVIVTGIFVSGVPYFSMFNYGLPYVFSVLALAGLVRLMTAGAQAATLRLFFFAMGMGSSFLFLLDGHLVLIVPVALVILHFGREDTSLKEWAILAAYCLAAFVAGFVFTYLVNMAGKIMIFGWNLVASDFFEGLSARLSSTLHTGERVPAPEAVSRLLWFYPRMAFMGNERLGGTLIDVSLIAFLLGAAVAAVRFRLAGSVAPAAGFIVVAVAIGVAFARVGILPNHSATHPSFMSRYMFVPIALAMSGLIAAWWRLPAARAPSPPPPPAPGGRRRGRRARSRR